MTGTRSGSAGIMNCSSTINGTAPFRPATVAEVSFPVEEELSLPDYPEYKAFLTGEMTGAEIAAVPEAAFIKLR